MHKEISSNSNKNPDSKKINVIIADTRWETFEQIPGLDSNINFLNLSSNFAVNFILEYERIDVIIISRTIKGLDDIKKKASKNKSSLYILGEDIRYPIDSKQVGEILEKERISRSKNISSKKPKGITSVIKNFFGLEGEQRLKRHEKKDSGIKKDKVNDDISWLEEIGQEDKEVSKDIENNDNKAGVQEGSLKEDDNKEVKDLQDDDLINKENQDDYERFFWGGKDEKTNRSLLSNFIAIKQKIIVFLKAKGGVGSTLLSLFLAYHFRKLKTLLVDLNFCEGGSDLGYYLSIPKSPNMIVFIEGYNRNSMDNSVVKIKENLDVL